ncbi:hypothetical protein Pmani_029361 [Petrolisthes manimaculis]|uniref:Uncharacterized protein n=1 Tax=Petrolisthes manimaculis TaxID=1843537 RepID=A0AAE1TX22_9EUCA|nr:hypothetical protein Pmani_029361 [Petrolisthes manimaculis]
MRLFVVWSLGLVMAFMVVQAHADTDQLRDIANLDNPELLTELDKNDVDEKDKTEKVRVRVRADKDDDYKRGRGEAKKNTDTNRRMRVQNKKARTKSSDSSVKGQKQSCPGKCIRSDASCKGGRVLKNACKKGICCITGDKKDGKIKPTRKGSGAKRKCKALDACSSRNGECVKPKKKCKSNEISATNSDGKYCSKMNCKCCFREGDDVCLERPKCINKGGQCVKGECTSGKFKQGKKWCANTDCKCCLPGTADCVTKPKCERIGGTCTGENKCDGDWTQAKKFCVGANCGCCVKSVDSPAKCETTQGHLAFCTNARAPTGIDSVLLKTASQSVVRL